MPRIHRSPGWVIASSGGQRHVVGVDEAVLERGIEQPRQLVGIEAEDAEVVVARLQLAQLDRQQVVVPVGPLAGLVVGDAVGADLLGRQVGGDVDRNLGQLQLHGRLVAGVAHDDDAVGVNDDRLAEAKLAERGGHDDDGVVVEARVARVGTKLGQVAKLDLHGRLRQWRCSVPPPTYRNRA